MVFGKNGQLVIGGMQVKVVSALLFIPVTQCPGQFQPGVFKVLSMRYPRKTVGQHKFGLVIESPQQLPFPAVPDIGTNSLDIADGQNRRSIVWTVSEKSVIVLWSFRSRDCATLFMIRCSRTSQETVAVSACVNPRRGQSLRAIFSPATEWFSGLPLAISCRKVAT